VLADLEMTTTKLPGRGGRRDVTCRALLTTVLGGVSVM